jgi:hypothetical protein
MDDTLGKRKKPERNHKVAARYRSLSSRLAITSCWIWLVPS